MSIPHKSEESAHRIFLKYQIAMEKAIADLHKNVSISLADIISRNTNADGTVNKAKIKLIVDKYMTQELKQYRMDLMNQIKTGVSDGANQGMRAVIGAVAPNRNVTADKWVNLSKSIRKNIVNLKGVDGITLSDRVWKMTDDNIYNLKRIISSDILQGKSSDEISRNIRKYLIQPETLRGRAKAEARPGQGVYKSAYKNAVRVARTETNRAYIDGQKLTTADMGYKMELRVAGINVCDECAGLNEKVFEPADFPAPVHPNCYDDKTEVYTNSGWKYFNEIKNNDKILSLKNDFNLEYVKYKNKIEYKYNGKMIHIYNRNFDLMTTPEHNQYVGFRSDRIDRKHIEFRFIKTKDLSNNPIFYRSSKWLGKNKKYIKIGKNKLSIELYCKFMGWYLSEGSVVKRKNCNSWQIVISQRKEDKKEILDNDLIDLPYKLNKFDGGIRIYDDELGKYLMQFGKSYEKYIPDEIKSLPSEYIKIFLERFRMGDGSIRNKKWKNGNFKDEEVYFTSSKRMADDIGEMILKAGYRPSFYLQKTKALAVKHSNGIYTSKYDMWIIRKCYSQYAMKTYRKEIDYNRIVYCLELEKNHTMLTRRNGKVVWSGNCMCYSLTVTGE